ncbi:MAG: PPC domain-containing protein, partial [Planctomycetota bacterium]
IWTHDLRGGADTAIELLDDTGTVLDSAEDGGMADGASYLHYDFTALPAGIYYIRVVDEQGSTGAYDLSVRAGPMGPDYCEFDDDVETSDHIRPWRSIDTPLVGGSAVEVQRTFHLAGDVDWLVYSVAADGAFMRHMIDSVILGDCTPDFKFYEADGDQIKVLETNELSGPGINRITLTAGLYYIRVVDQAGTGTGSYKVQASVSAP